MLKRLAIALAVLLAFALGAAGGAWAQSSPGFSTGQVPTATQWNGYFAGKADTTNGQLTTPTINSSTINGHFTVGTATAPTLSSCGTGPAIVGTDMSGRVQMGTSATGCVITFAIAYGHTPACQVTWETQVAAESYSISATAITLTQTSTDSNVVDYTCIGQLSELPGSNGCSNSLDFSAACNSSYVAVVL